MNSEWIAREALANAQHEIEHQRKRIAALLHLEDEVERLHNNWETAELKLEQSNARIAELEAANTRMWADYEKKRERVAALEAERDRLQEQIERWRERDEAMSGKLLFDHMADEHGVSLLDSEMYEIRLICRRMDEREHEEWNRDLAAAREQIAALEAERDELRNALTAWK